MSEKIEELREKLKDIDKGHPDSQWIACKKLGELEDPDSRERIISNQKIIIADLISALDAQISFALTRGHAALGLGKFGKEKLLEGSNKEKTIKKLIERLEKDDCGLVRSYSARALGNIDDESAIPALIRALNSKVFFGVRAESASALKNICSNSSTDNCKKARKELLEILKQIANEIEKGGSDKKQNEGLIRILKEFIGQT